MRGTDLRVRHGYVKTYPSQDGDMHLQEATVYSQGLIGTQEHLISTYPHEGGVYTSAFGTESTLSSEMNDLLKPIVHPVV